MSFEQETKAVFRNLDRIVLLALCVLFLLYVASGVFVVEANEKAVVFRFGAAGDVISPGIGYHWPWPIERVRKVNVKEVQRVEVGFWPDSGFREELLRYCLTGDKNIIHNRYVIQYRIADPANYLSSARRVRELLVELAEATMLEVVASKQVDPILTTGKVKMEQAILKGLNEKLLELDVKLQIVGIERQSAEPPSLVKDAFQDVINAREEKRTQIHEADNYSNQEVPKAKGDADRMLQLARAYKFERVSSAKGESERFSKLYAEYKEAPEVTINRLFIEMAERTLPKTKIMVLATDQDGQPLRVKVLQAPIPTTPRLPE